MMFKCYIEYFKYFLFSCLGWEGECDETEDESKAIEFERSAEAKNAEKIKERQMNLDAKGNLYEAFFGFSK